MLNHPEKSAMKLSLKPTGSLRALPIVSHTLHSFARAENTMSTEQTHFIDWDRYRTELQRLYLTEDRTLDETANYMYQFHGLSAT